MPRLSRLFRNNAVTAARAAQLCELTNAKLESMSSEARVATIDTEFAYYIEFHDGLTLAGLSEQRKCIS
jgi:hypothetical protein